MAATNWANRAFPVGGGPRGPGGPGGPAGPGTGGGSGGGVVLLHLPLHLLHLRVVGLVQPSQKPNVVMNRAQPFGLTVDLQGADDGSSIGRLRTFTSLLMTSDRSRLL